MTDAKFVYGSITRHVVVMTVTVSIGLIAAFVVDTMSLLYVSRLGVVELTAAVGFASTLMFFVLSIVLGLTIPTSALVAQYLGQGDRQNAAETAAASMIFMSLVTISLTLILLPSVGTLLRLLGAHGDTLRRAERFAIIVLPSVPFFGFAMCAVAILRAFGEARSAMFITLFGAASAAVLDPIFIFALGMGLDGAAIATLASRALMCALAWRCVYGRYAMVRRPTLAKIQARAKPFFELGISAIVSQLATPISSAYMMGVLGRLGNDAVAGMAVISRLVPFIFVALFALSGALGPLFAQNYSASQHSRLFAIIRVSLVLSSVYVIALWSLMAISADFIADLFDASAGARSLIVFFCWFLSGAYLFEAAIIVAGAAFNNLGYARHSIALNWACSTVGVFPFVSLGAAYYGAKGALAGSAIGIVVFGLIAAIWCFWIVKRLSSLQPELREGALDARPKSSASQ